MDGSRFDSLARSLSTARSRRGTLAGLLGAALSLVGAAEVDGKPHAVNRKPQ
jgi:hypothetical protein